MVTVPVSTSTALVKEVPSKAPECITKECVRDMIELYARRYGVNQKLAVKVATCESELRTDVYGDHGLAYGVFQFHEPTFEMFAKAYGDEDMEYKNPEDNIKLAMLAISHGEGRHWTCHTKVKKGLI